MLLPQCVQNPKVNPGGLEENHHFHLKQRKMAESYMDKRRRSGHSWVGDRHRIQGDLGSEEVSMVSRCMTPASGPSAGSWPRD